MQRREQTAPNQDKWLMTGGVISDARTSLLCFQLIVFRESNRTPFRNCVMWCLFMLCIFPWRWFTIHSHRNLINSWARLKDKTFAFVGIILEHLESWEVLCSSSRKFDCFSRSGIKILRELIRCLYNNVIDRLFVATSQSTNDRRLQTLSPDINQKALIHDPTVH